MKEFDSDVAIIEAINKQTNLNRAITFLYKNHYDMLENLVKKNSGNVMDAEDIIQETMINFIEMVKEQKFRGEASIKSMLYSIAKNLWLTKLRKNSAEALRIEKYSADADQFEDDISRQIQKREAKSMIDGLFDKIGDSCRQVLTLFYYEELSFKEILERTSYENEQVLRNKKYKCMKALTDLVASTGNNQFKNTLVELI